MHFFRETPTENPRKQVLNFLNFSLPPSYNRTKKHKVIRLNFHRKIWYKNLMIWYKNLMIFVPKLNDSYKNLMNFKNDIYSNMVIYECDKCHKIFTHKSVYTKHCNKKNPCTKIIANEKNVCNICGKEFSSYHSLYAHIKNNVCNKKDNLNITNNMKVDMNIDTLNNNNLNVDGDVKVVKFGSENLSYISDDLFKQILGRGFRAVEMFIEHSHFNKKHPENHNIYIANIKDEFIVFYDGDKWLINERDIILEDIIYAKSDLLFDKFKQLRGEMTQSDIIKFMRFMNERDNNETMNKLKKDITLRLYNNRKIPQAIRRHMEARQTIKLRTKIYTKNKKMDALIKTLENMDDCMLDQIKHICEDTCKKIDK